VSTVKEVQSVRNACVVLEAIAASQPVGVSELSRLTGIDKSTVHRIAITLQSAGWLRPTTTPPTRWEISPFSRLLAAVATSNLEVDARPAMLWLREQTGETAMLAVLKGRILFVEAAIESHHQVRMSPTIGLALPFSGSAGHAVAAALPDTELEEFARLHPELDRASLANVRKVGFATNDGDVDHEVRAVATALTDADGYPLGALAVAAPASRMSAEDMRRFGELVVDAASRLVRPQTASSR
jgi:IclR family acetate operon transcriptional repressor